MTQPLLIIKTAEGFAVVEFTADLPAISIQKLRCFGDLEDSYSYRHDGVLAAIKRHFADKPEPATLQQVA